MLRSQIHTNQLIVVSFIDIDVAVATEWCIGRIRHERPVHVVTAVCAVIHLNHHSVQKVGNALNYSVVLCYMCELWNVLRLL